MRTETKVSSSGPGFDTGPKKIPSRLIARVLSCILMMVICLNMAVPAHAYSSVHIQCSIDLATWEILTGVVTDEVGLTATSPEWRRMTEDDLKELKNSSGSFSSALSLIDAGKVESRDKELAHSGHFLGVGGIVQNAGIGVEESRVLTFPTDQNKRDSSNSIDAENALRVNNEITFDLNQAFSVYCEKEGIVKTPDAVKMLEAVNSFMSDMGSKVSGDHVKYFASANGDEEVDYRWRTKKYTDGSEYVTWAMLIVEAFNNYSLAGEDTVDSGNVYSSTPNQLTKGLIGVFRSLLDGLRSILGLWSMDELLFCDGWRNAGYVGGIFPRTWEPMMWGLFIFMEIIAAMILGFGIINNVLKQAAASINTIARMRVMSQIQDLFVCGAALAILPIALRMVVALSGNFVDMIGAMRPINAATGEAKAISDMVSRFSQSSGSLGGVVVEFLYFGIQIYFNFFYAIRSLTVFILIVLAPIMIAMITVSPARKQMTMNWLREILANILIQPIQTFCITVILLLPTFSHKFDNMIALYAMIPLTSMVRGLFFGASGSWADQVAQKGKAGVEKMSLGAAGGAARVAAGGIGSIIGSKLGKEKDDSFENRESGSESSNTQDNTNLGSPGSRNADSQAENTGSNQVQSASPGGENAAQAGAAASNSNSNSGNENTGDISGAGVGSSGASDTAAPALADARNAASPFTSPNSGPTPQFRPQPGCKPQFERICSWSGAG